MRERGGVREADVKSDAGSSRREEKGAREKNDSGKHQEHSNSRPGSRKSGKSVRDGEIEEQNYGSDSSASSHKPYSNPVQYTDQERAELLRRLDSIKEHLLRGSNVVDKPKESDQTQTPLHFLGPGNNVPGTSFYHPYHEPFPYGGRMYPSTSNPAHIPGYRDPFGFQPHRRPPTWHLGHYPSPMSHQYGDMGPDILEPHPQDPRFHRFFQAPPSRYGDVPPYSTVLHQPERFTAFGSHSCNSSSTFHSSMSASDPQGHTRWPSDLDSETGGAFARGYVQNAVSDTGARRCHPLAGGAPFIACHNCFELLYLPKKALIVLEKPKKLQCGACSEVISFTIVDKKLAFTSGQAETDTVSRDVRDGTTSTAAVANAGLNSHGHVSQPSADLSFVDYSDSGNNLQCMDEEPAEESTEIWDTHNVRSESRREHSDDEKSKISDGQQRVVKSVRRRVKDANFIEPTPAQGSSLLELFEHSNINRVALGHGMAQLSLNSEKQESYSKQDSLNPESVATETEVSYNGYSNTDASEDFRDSTRSKEDSRLRSSKGSGSGLVEVTKNGSKDQNEEKGKSPEVWVNGQLIPEDQVRSAEKLAGPIQPGNYWYDYRAGFWGVMGKPCIGIIPPYIEELSHRPMPEDCSGGNTGVFVNGRELHKRDLDLLAGRGLPREMNRSYIIEMSGIVIDGDSGEELDRLGKLAPTVEKAKQGFGMRVPRARVS